MLIRRRHFAAAAAFAFHAFALALDISPPPFRRFISMLYRQPFDILSTRHLLFMSSTLLIRYHATGR